MPLTCHRTPQPLAHTAFSPWCRASSPRQVLLTRGGVRTPRGGPPRSSSSTGLSDITASAAQARGLTLNSASTAPLQSFPPRPPRPESLCCRFLPGPSGPRAHGGSLTLTPIFSAGLRAVAGRPAWGEGEPDLRGAVACWASVACRTQEGFGLEVGFSCVLLMHAPSQSTGELPPAPPPPETPICPVRLRITILLRPPSHPHFRAEPHGLCFLLAPAIAQNLGGPLGRGCPRSGLCLVWAWPSAIGCRLISCRGSPLRFPHGSRSVGSPLDRASEPAPEEQRPARLQLCNHSKFSL